MLFSKENYTPYQASKASHNSWIAEAIWGHRIERQPAHGLLLEFLSMAEGMRRQGKLLSHEPGYASYTPCLSTQLRNILFNNPTIEEIAKECGNDDEAWDRWFTVMKEAAVAKQSALLDFRYLKGRFDSFHAFVEIVVLLRNITLDSGSDRGWTNKRIYPIGPAALYDERDKNFNSTRNFFTRTGELAYLMISRASEELRKDIAEKLIQIFDPSAPKNILLLRLMSGETSDMGEEKSDTYLPHLKHPAFERMAEDIQALLQLGLPGADAFNHMGPLLALHVLLYQLETANVVIGGEGLPDIVCEILAPKTNLVRRASVSSLRDNESLGIRALEQYVDKQLSADDELQDIIKNTELDEAAKCEVLRSRLCELFSIKEEKELLIGFTVDDILREFLRSAKKAYEKAGGDATRSLGDQCGLRSSQKTNQYRYSPSDQFLRNLVYVMVKEPIKDSDFLIKIYQRYRLVIGPEEAQYAVREDIFDKPEFEKNNDRLLRRLIAMGLARRMSDSFTYIINPIVQNHAA